MKPLLNHSEIAAWAERQEPDAEYHYGDSRSCALFIYLKSKGAPVSSVGPYRWTENGEKNHPFNCALAKSLITRPWTFGALADRLKAAS